MTERFPRKIELLAPAKDMATAIAAIDHGADAVYMGPSAFGARSQAGNSIEDIRKVADYAHQFGAKVYATVNTIIYDNELKEAQQLCWDLWRAGVDALIVQDLALTQIDLPPIALHASTQCDTRDAEKARFLSSLGFTRLVLARELTTKEIREIHQTVAEDLEVFVHGALCVSYSGDCQASYMITGRSANRGECCQVCRFKFDLEDKDGNKLITGKHLLSLKDMNRLESLEELLDAGATSLKIEGRLKDVAYVKNVVAAYRKRLDEIIARNPDRYCRSSIGRSEINFIADPTRSFNRGFTDYFLHNTKPTTSSLASFNTPKWIGKEVGKVTRHNGKQLTANLKEELHNGDGLGYFNNQGEFKGFRLNRVEGNKLFPASAVDIPIGTVLYRNADKKFDDLLQSDTAKRKIALNITLEFREEKVLLKLEDESGIWVETAETIELNKAKSPQTERRRAELSKLGDTIFYASEVIDDCGEIFIPASILSRMRRRGIELLEAARKSAYKREQPGIKKAVPQIGVTRHNNIANRITAKLFSQITGIATAKLPFAVEVSKPSDKEVQVMETRYCLRRELGACLKEGNGKALPSPLYLTSAGNRWRLDFDCANCRMKLMWNG